MHTVMPLPRRSAQNAQVLPVLSQAEPDMISLPALSAHVSLSQGQTALHWAAKRGYASVVQLLVTQGADVNAVDNQVMFTLLHVHF